MPIVVLSYFILTISTVIAGPLYGNVSFSREDCFRTPEQWTVWREQFITTAMTQRKKLTDEERRRYWDTIINGRKLFEFCIEQETRAGRKYTVPACVDRTYQMFLKSFADDPTVEAKYQGLSDIPSFLLDQNLLEAVAQTTSVNQLRDVINAYQARGSFPKDSIHFAFETKMIRDEGGVPFKAPRWFGFLPGPQGESDRYLLIHHHRNFAVIVNIGTVYRKADGSKALFLSRFDRPVLKEGKSLKIDFHNSRNAQSCTVCHKSGLIFPSPTTNGIHAADLPLLAQITRAIKKEGRLPVYAEKWVGPRLGEVDEQIAKGRTDEFFEGCSFGTGLSKSHFPLLRESMKCAKCHNNVDRGELTEGIGLDGGEFLRSAIQYPGVLTMMPPRLDSHSFVNQSDEDLFRETLYECLMDEFYGTGTHTGTIEQWLREIQCTSSVK